MYQVPYQSVKNCRTVYFITLWHRPTNQPYGESYMYICPSNFPCRGNNLANSDLWRTCKKNNYKHNKGHCQSKLKDRTVFKEGQKKDEVNTLRISIIPEELLEHNFLNSEQRTKQKNMIYIIWCTSNQWNSTFHCSKSAK